MAHALPVEVYKHRHGDCSNGGITSRFNEVLVPCESDDPMERGFVEYDPANPPENLMTIERRDMFGQVLLTLVPHDDNGRWHMYGGCKADTCDSRWGKMLARVGGPIYRFNSCLDIHDRYE